MTVCVQRGSRQSQKQGACSPRDRARDAPEGTRTLAEQGEGNVVAGIHESLEGHGADMRGHSLTLSLSFFLRV